jgi:hypothetical protein
MLLRFRQYEADCLVSGSRSSRQLIVAVTANGSQLGRAGEPGGFDEVCPKPVSAADIHQIIQKRLQL